MRKLFLGVLLVALPTSPASAALFERTTPYIHSPGATGTVFGTSAVLDIKGCRSAGVDARFTVRVDGKAVSPVITKGAYKSQWMVTVPVGAAGKHRVEVQAFCDGRYRRARSLSVDVTSRTSGSLDAGYGVADQWTANRPAANRQWDWGDAILMFGMARLGGKYTDYVRAYHTKWANRRLSPIDRADACAPALSAMALYRAGDTKALDHVGPVVDYLRNKRRNAVGGLDHVGHSISRFVVPSSVWVDSLMMMSVFSAQYGKTKADKVLYDFGTNLPALYAKYLVEPTTNLWRHAYFIKARRTAPWGNTYWLRGNAWALVSIAENMDEIDPASPLAAELKTIFMKNVDALAQYQMADGLWDTIANVPGHAYPESSGTLLTSYAIARAVNRGWLDARYMPMAKRAFAGVSAKLRKTADGYSVPGNSGPTDPGGREYYSSIPQEVDAPYGVSGYLLAAHELRNETF